MTDADSARRIERDRYRAVAHEIRALIPRLSHSEAIEDLRLLAIRYESLAERLEAAPWDFTARVPGAPRGVERRRRPRPAPVSSK
jgi:hypothetical protein